MTISICIPSYNRPNELERCLKSIPASIGCEIVISDDCSPNQLEVTKRVKKFQKSHNIKYIPRDKNIGYDMNLNFLANQATQEFILFISDDDFFYQESLKKLFNEISTLNDASVILTPVMGLKNMPRRKLDMTKHNFLKTNKSIAGFIYESILFSGLIFNRQKFLNFDVKNFKNSIYFQVYVASMLAIKYGYGYIDQVILKVGGDGENGFGSQADKDKDLADRTSVLSDLNYHKRLHKIVKQIIQDSERDFMSAYRFEYTKRLLPRFIEMKSKKMGFAKDLKKEVLREKIALPFLTHVFYFSASLMPSSILKGVNNLKYRYYNKEQDRKEF